MQIAIVGANRNRPDELLCVDAPVVPRVGDSIRLFGHDGHGPRVGIATVIDVQWPIFLGDLPYPVDGVAHGKPVVYVHPIESIHPATKPEGN